MYAPPADWDIIARVKEAVSVPVIGNGDVVCAETAAQMYRHTNCDLVMIGRGSLGKPWLMGQVAEYLRTGIIPPEPSPEEKMTALLGHIRLACAYKGEYRAMREARAHAGHYFHGWKNAAELRRRAGKLETLADLESLIDYALRQCRGDCQSPAGE
jgi:tRNA-dihydrouridine synthase